MSLWVAWVEYSDSPWGSYLIGKSTLEFCVFFFFCEIFLSRCRQIYFPSLTGTRANIWIFYLCCPTGWVVNPPETRVCKGHSFSNPCLSVTSWADTSAQFFCVFFVWWTKPLHVVCALLYFCVMCPKFNNKTCLGHTSLQVECFSKIIP